MILEQLRQECYAAVQESNDRWNKISEKVKNPKIVVQKLPSNSIAVKVYDLEKSLVAEFQSINQAARFVGVKEHFVRKSVMRNIFIETKYGELRFER